MKIIRQNTPNFLVDLSQINTADYAEEDILILFDETTVRITLPPANSIKGNPSIYFQCVSTNIFIWELHLSGTDYFQCNSFVNPAGKISLLSIDQNISPADTQTAVFKPLAGGSWIGINGIM